MKNQQKQQEKHNKNTQKGSISPSDKHNSISPYGNLDSYIDIWGEAAPGGGDFTPQLSIGLCKVNLGNLDSKNDPISPYANLDSYMEKWAEVVLAAQSVSNIASGSALGAPTQRKKILLAMEKWTHANNNKKNIKIIQVSEKCENQRTPRQLA